MNNLSMDKDNKLSFKDKCKFLLYLNDKLDNYWSRLYYSTITIVVAILGSAYVNMVYIPVFVAVSIMFLIYSISCLYDHIFTYHIFDRVRKELDKDCKYYNSRNLTLLVRSIPIKGEIFLCYFSYIGVEIVIIALMVYVTFIKK